MVVPSDPSPVRRRPVATPVRDDLRARPSIGALTALCAIVAMAGAVAARDPAVVVVGAAIALVLAGTTGVIWSRWVFAPQHRAPTSATALPAPATVAGGLATADPALRTELDSVERRQQQDLAQRLHDGPLQHVITALQDVTDLREGEDVDLTDLELTLREAIAGMRETATDLYDDVVRDAGLAAALGQVAKTAERAGGPAVDVAVAAETSSVHDALVVSAARELLTNVRKHARATQALVVVERTRDGLLRLVVDDDGIGFDEESRRAAAARGHLGLRSVEDRARRAGGRLVATSTGHGSVVQVLLPLDDDVRDVASPGAPGRSWTGGGRGRLVGA